MTTGLRCQRCGTPLTGKQQRWCSQRCAVLGWEMTHRDARNAIKRRWLASKAIPPDRRGIVRVPVVDLTRVEASHPEVGQRFREAVADVKFLAHAS